MVIISNHTANYFSWVKCFLVWIISWSQNDIFLDDIKLVEYIQKVLGYGISARPLYGNIVTFEPTHLIVLLTNHKPEINVSESLTRRLVLIPFLAEFKDPNKINKNNKYHILKDKDLEFKLSDKLDELLVWLVKGSIKYFKDGLGKC